MTCIAAIKEKDGTIYMAADRQSTAGNMKMASSEPKVFVRGEFAYGVTGAHRIANILRYAFKEPPKAVGQSLMDYFVNSWIPTWTECLHHHGQKQIVHNVTHSEAWLMIGHEGKLMMMAGDFTIIEEEHPYAAIGSGGDFAKGALNVMRQSSDTQNANITLRKAVLAAIEHDTYCSGPVDIIELKPTSSI